MALFSKEMRNFLHSFEDRHEGMISLKLDVRGRGEGSANSAVAFPLVSELKLGEGLTYHIIII